MACVVASSSEMFKLYMESIIEFSKKPSQAFDLENSNDDEKIKADIYSNISFSPSLLLDPNIYQSKGRKERCEWFQFKKNTRGGVECIGTKTKRKQKV